MTTPLDLLKHALSTPYGVLITVSSIVEANRLRRKLYLERNRQRKTGNDLYEQLSIVVDKRAMVLKIIKWQMIRTFDKLEGEIFTWPLSRADLEHNIIRRGKSKLGEALRFTFPRA